jgi:hypothetical protein
MSADNSVVYLHQLPAEFFGELTKSNLISIFETCLASNGQFVRGACSTLPKHSNTRAVWLSSVNCIYSLAVEAARDFARDNVDDDNDDTGPLVPLSWSLVQSMAKKVSVISPSRARVWTDGAIVSSENTRADEFSKSNLEISPAPDAAVVKDNSNVVSTDSTPTKVQRSLNFGLTGVASAREEARASARALNAHRPTSPPRAFGAPARDTATSVSATSSTTNTALTDAYGGWERNRRVLPPAHAELVDKIAQRGEWGRFVTVRPELAPRTMQFLKELDEVIPLPNSDRLTSGSGEGGRRERHRQALERVAIVELLRATLPASSIVGDVAFLFDTLEELVSFDAAKASHDRYLVLIPAEQRQFHALPPNHITDDDEAMAQIERAAALYDRFGAATKQRGNTPKGETTSNNTNNTNAFTKKGGGAKGAGKREGAQGDSAKKSSPANNKSQ